TGVGATPPTLTVLGQTLSGNFIFEQLTVAGGEKITRLAVDQVSLSIGDGTTTFLAIDQGRGSLFISAAGVAGQLSAHVNTNTTAFTLSSIGIAVNTTSSAVAQTFTIGATVITLDLPAGPYARVEATGAALNVAGQSLTGNFAFDRAVDERGVAVAVSQVKARHPQAVAVALLFAFRHPEHERRLVTALAAALPDVPVTASHDVLPVFREYERFATTTAAAYLRPLVSDYMQRA